jgi:hypothetical protein
MKHSASRREIDGNEQGLAILEIDLERRADFVNLAIPFSSIL